MDSYNKKSVTIAESEDDYQRAAEWLETLAEGPLDEVTERRFLLWLQSGEQRRVIFERMLATWQDPALTQALEKALSVTPRVRRSRFISSRSPILSMITGRTLGYGLMTGLGVLVLCITLYNNGAWHLPPAPETMHLSTPVNEQREQQLADGSHVEVAASTQLDVTLKHNHRLVNLQRGAAYFTVAPDRARPFEVRIDSASVIAVGTQFNIDRFREGVDITVYEGAVEVRDQLDGRPRLLRAGERVRISSRGGMSATQAIDIHQIVDWRSGWIEVEDESLGYLIDYLNRYSNQPIVLSDDLLAQDRVAGRFRVSDSETTLAMLAEFYQLDVIHRAEHILVQRSEQRHP